MLKYFFLSFDQQQKKKNYMLADLSRGRPEGFVFNIYNHQRIEEGTTPFSEFLRFTLDPYLIMLKVKQRDIKYQFFESLVWLDLGLNNGLPGYWRTLKPLYQWGDEDLCI